MDLRELPGYVLGELRDNYDDRFWWRNRLLHRVVGPFHLNVYPTRRGSMAVPEADWDTLVVLDACRVDLFERRVDLDRFDSYEVVTSRGSATQEWTRQNWADGTFGETVYVTANPFVSREAGDVFHEIYEPWLTHFEEETKTVHPSDVTDVALKAHESHPDKRVVVHYMQPHHPFITAPELQFHGWDIDGFDAWNEQKSQTGLDEEQTDAHPHTPWEALYMGLVDRDAIWDAYGENLEVTMAAVEELLDGIEGRIAVTSDHGNMVGERTWPVPMRVFGHPSGVRNNELVDVPWAVVDRGERRTIAEGSVESASESGGRVVEDRLADLGYV